MAKCQDFGTFGDFGELPFMEIRRLGEQHFLEVFHSFSNMGCTVGGTLYAHLPSLQMSIDIQDSYCAGQDSEMYKDNENYYDSLVDSSGKDITKVMVIRKKWKGSGDNPITIERTEYVLNDSCIFRPVTK